MTRRCLGILRPLSLQSCSIRDGIRDDVRAYCPRAEIIARTRQRAYSGRRSVRPRRRSAGLGLAAARAETDVLGELGTLPCVVRRHHRIIGWQAPAFAI